MDVIGVLTRANVNIVLCVLACGWMGVGEEAVTVCVCVAVRVGPV